MWDFWSGGSQNEGKRSTAFQKLPPKIAPVKPTTSKMQLASHDSGRWKIVNLEMFERQNLGSPFC